MRLPLLALLAKEPAHGYELKSRLEQMFGDAYPSPNIGQVYLTLQRLEKAGLVCSEDVAQAARPNKRVYELTPAGREAVVEWLESPSDGPRVRDDFFMKLALGPLTGDVDRLGLINRQRRYYLGPDTRAVEPGLGEQRQPDLAAAHRGLAAARPGRPGLAGAVPGGAAVTRTPHGRGHLSRLG